ncbi:hypothetical protein C8R43DRAFT_1120178 [Mycena crocata]|nr:hypothetical protein C8R43DRAFT_1120178 [Mycena crocata]
MSVPGDMSLSPRLSGSPDRRQACSEPTAGAAQFSRGLMVTTVDFPGRRRKGSGSWAGWACTSYFIDPETGIAAVFGTQLLPQAGFDMAYEMLWIQVEEAIYKGVQK